MLAWMLYVVFITLLLSGAALAAERAARLRRTRTRWIWMLSIVASLGIPTVIASVSLQVPSFLIPTVTHNITALREMTAIHLAPLTWVREHAGRSAALSTLNLELPGYWGAVSAALVAVLVLYAAYTAWRTQAWWMGRVEGARVYIAPHVGPGVVGFLRPRVVVPAWLTDSAPSCRQMVIAHEQAHLARHDPQVFTVALIMVILMPWNLPLWWQLYRLRRAMEVDCDAMVLERGLDARDYAAMLREVGRGPARYFGATTSMTEFRSSLADRVRIVVGEGGKRRPAVAAALGGLSLALLAVAAQVTPPNVAGAGSGEPHALTLAPEVLDRYVGFYVRGSHAVVRISREGSRLFRQRGTGPSLEIVAETETDFWQREDNSVHESFVMDKEGGGTGVVEHSDRPKFSYLLPRVDPAVAQQILARARIRSQSQAPLPGSEAALRRMVDGVREGKCIEEQAPWFKKLCEETIRDFQWDRLFASWGAVQSVRFLRVDDTGQDIYEVRQQHGRTEWSIYLDDYGLIQDADSHE